VSRCPPSQKGLPLDAWPRADRDAWVEAKSTGPSLLRDGGMAAHMRPGTQDDLARRYGYFLRFVGDTGLPLDERCPASAVTEEAMLGYVETMAERLSSVTLAASVRKIGRMAILLAPNQDRAWLRTLWRRLEAISRPADKRPRMVEAARLEQLGSILMNQAEAATDMTAFSRARRYRDGLIIAVLGNTLLRLANITSLTLGQTFIETGSCWHIAIPRAESKNGDPIELPLPAALSPRIERWLSHYRCAFRGHDTTDALWLSRNGRPLSSNRLYGIVMSHTREAFGRAVNPHLFRDCAVTSTARHDGAHVRVVSAALGHRSPRTTEKYYNQNDMVSAVHNYHSQVLGVSSGERL
jgi:integrase/recombinase XerD